MGLMDKIKALGGKSEPATDFDYTGAGGYYGIYGGDVGVEDGDDVRVVISEDVTESSQLLKRTFTPVCFEDVYAIVDSLKEGRVSVICIEELDKATFFRIFDYIMGAAQALDAELSKIDRETVVLLPAGFDEETSIDELDEEIIEVVDEEDVPATVDED